MKIIDAVKNEKGNPFVIPGSSRNDLPEFFKEMGFKTGVEVGVYKGEYSELLCKAGLKVYGIEPYITYKNYRKHPQELPYEELETITKERLAPFKDFILIKKTSMEALVDIPDESQDFVYIDANHSLPYITQDIYEWQRKVRVGGVISGHDYFIDGHNPYWIRACHVKYAVDTCVKIFGVENFYVVGDGKDKCPSWMWVKK